MGAKPRPLSPRLLAILAGLGLALVLAIAALRLGSGAQVAPEMVLVRIALGSYNSSQLENFVPKDITVVIGINNTVVWRNEDRAAHDVVGEGFRSPLLGPGEEFRFTFTRPGVYAYFCSPHPWMQGLVRVLQQER